jgi:predicted ferric reductase
MTYCRVRGYLVSQQASTAVATPRAARGGPATAATGFGWLLLYLLVGLTPLVVAVTVNPPPARDFWLEFSVALGFVGLAMLGVQFAIVSRFSTVNAPYGLDVVLNFHREFSFVAFAFVLAHPAIIVIRDPDLLHLLNPVTAHWTARFGLISVAALIALIVSSVWRKRLGIRYEVWRITHGLLAVTVVVAALVHIERVGYYVAGPWKRGFWIAMSAVFLVLLVNVYFIQPLRLRNRPWEVVSVERERGDSWTLRIRPVGHGGVRFAPGQFAWIRVNRSPFAIREHPFSFSSTAEITGDESIAFTIAEAGDFTSRIGALRPGDRVYVDGPYGVFSFERNEGPRFVFVAGGIGISPVMSMLRTLADRGDKRPCLLVYGNPTWEDVTFREELEALRQRLDLTIVHVLEQPPEGWSGETGFVDAEILERHLGEHPQRARFFLCGPPPMMEALLAALDQLGVPDRHIDLEVFNLV